MKRAIAFDNIINSTDKSVLEHQRDHLKCHHQLHQTGYDSNFPAFFSDPIVGTMGPDLRWVNGWSGFGFGSGMGLETKYGSVVTEGKETPSILSETSRSGCFKKRKLENVKGVGALMQADDDKESKKKMMIRRFEEDEEEDEKSKITEENVGSSKSITKKKKVTKDQQNSSNDFSKGDYIHVRARRGQATDSHSLAERVRREKISERMKFLQDLVPGCNKITCKAGMLDEIINYVQSLQSQIDFLSMKLATMNPRLDFEAVDDIFGKEVIQAQTTNFTNVVLPSHDMVNSGSLEFNPVQQVVQCSGTEANISDPMWDSEIQKLCSILGFDQGLSPLTTFTSSQPF